MASYRVREAASACAAVAFTLLIACVHPASATPPRARDWLSQYEPRAAASSIVRIGDTIRFTVLRDAVIRMEYDAEGQFDDDASWAIVNRRFEGREAAFTHTVDGSVHTIETSNLVLRYDEDPAHGTSLNSANLAIDLRVAPFSKWVPGSPATGNMHGTIRTLDRVGDPVSLACPPVTTFYIYYSHCEESVISKDGWALIDDTHRPRFVRGADPDWTWIRSTYPRAIEGAHYSDVYFFGHGRDYMGAMKDYIAMSGRIPLMPRYALGPAFSRWFQWNDIENVAVVQNGFADNGIPLDVLVVDMDWHHTHPRGLPNPYGVTVEGWTGLTVYPYLFPEAAHMLAYLQRRGVQVTFNHHPAAGVEFHEQAYPGLAAALGMNVSEGKTIAFDIANITFAREYFKHAITPVDDLNMKYWWLDYQQEPFTTVAFANPTFMCNYAWWTNPYRYGPDAAGGRGQDRPMVMGRFGGLGSHRYNGLGFVGDTYVKWPVLRYETYFMSTASNVAFQWTHDLGGFEGYSPPEFFTRHLQFGCFSPALRTHSSKRSSARSIWTYPQPYFSVMRRFYRLRAALVPYLASAQRDAFETGIPVIRPIYWHYPAAAAAYADQGLHQYFFWKDTWVAPIAEAAPNVSVYNITGAGVTPWTIWVPPGVWVEWFSWQSVATTTAEGVFIARNYSVGEMPVFSRAGSIIHMRTLPKAGSVLGLASQVPPALTFTVMPVVSFPHDTPTTYTSNARVYDDDGATIAYEQGAYLWTNVSCTWSKGVSDVEADSLACTISPPEGAGFPEMPSRRSYTWRFIGTFVPSLVRVNGAMVARDPYGAPDAYGEDSAWNADSITWSYEPSTLSTWVSVSVRQPVNRTMTVALDWPTGVHVDDPLLTQGVARRLSRVISCKEEIDRMYGIFFSSDVESMLNVSAHVSRLAVETRAGAARTLLADMPGLLKAALREMRAWRIPEAHKAASLRRRCVAALQDALHAPTAAPLPSTDARVVAAMGESTYKYTVGAHMLVPDPTPEELAALNANADLVQ